VLPIWGRLLGVDLERAGLQVIPAGGWSASDATARLLDLIYPGAGIRVLLDAGPNSEAERAKILRLAGDRVLVELLPVVEVEQAYSWDAVREWLASNGALAEVVESHLAVKRGPVTKRALHGLARSILGRSFDVVSDGAKIAAAMREQDLSPDLKVVLLRTMGD
jgi:hypothetical protein